MDRNTLASIGSVLRGGDVLVLRLHLFPISTQSEVKWDELIHLYLPLVLIGGYILNGKKNVS